MRILRKAFLTIFGWTVKRLYDVLLLLRLYVLVLEREDARRGNKDGDSAQQRVDEGTAWIDFCDSLKGLADYVVAVPTSSPVAAGATSQQQLEQQQLAPGQAPSLDALDRREGVRYLTRVVRGGLEAFMDCWDPAWPVLRPLPYSVKLGADNPDNLYMYGTVSGAYSYRLVGRRGSVTYLSFGIYSGSRPGQGSGQPAHLDSSHLVTRPDGSFEIFLTPQPRGDNWLPLAPDASRIVVRQTFLNRTTEAAADVTIERLPATATGTDTDAGAGTGTGHGGDRTCGSSGNAAGSGLPGASGAASGVVLDARGREVKAALSAGQVVSGLAGAAVFIAGSVRQFQIWSRSFAARPNTLFTLERDAYMSAWADPAIHFFHGYWSVGPAEALLIQATSACGHGVTGRVTPPACPYWNFQVDNWWMESLDYVAHPETTVNKATASYMPDGSICLVVTHNDPRVGGVRRCRSPSGGREGPPCHGTGPQALPEGTAGKAGRQ